jgi:hypothetical protein
MAGSKSLVGMERTLEFLSGIEEGLSFPADVLLRLEGDKLCLEVKVRLGNRLRVVNWDRGPAYVEFVCEVAQRNISGDKPLKKFQKWVTRACNRKAKEWPPWTEEEMKNGRHIKEVVG